ncbi:MAG: SAM-dependent methyltransferase, partial [Clostridia bacterium]|nr:SAM-dependent methyltransferase [Clostridia bacterium]
MELKDCIIKITEGDIVKLVISKPSAKSNEFIKIVIEKKSKNYQISKYTKTQVFHENAEKEALSERVFTLTDGSFRQINAWDLNFEHMVMISKKGDASYKKKALSEAAPTVSENHNRSKNYILEAKPDILPLVDMGIFTKEGKVVASMYDKYKQINRYLEIIDDAIKDLKSEVVNIIDFGCGKSYLTFIVYYYLTYIKGIKANIIGLDLKKDVIEKCNEAAKRYNYENLRFELGDINGYKAPFSVDIVMTLHACDTATDFALFNAISWNAKMIFSVPCCQHELNSQIDTENLSAL